MSRMECGAGSGSRGLLMCSGAQSQPQGLLDLLLDLLDLSDLSDLLDLLLDLLDLCVLSDLLLDLFEGINNEESSKR